jgi:hypothetical protein
VRYTLHTLGPEAAASTSAASASTPGPAQQGASDGAKGTRELNLTLVGAATSTLNADSAVFRNGPPVVSMTVLGSGMEVSQDGLMMHNTSNYFQSVRADVCVTGA